MNFAIARGFSSSNPPTSLSKAHHRLFHRRLIEIGKLVTTFIVPTCRDRKHRNLLFKLLAATVGTLRLLSSVKSIRSKTVNRVAIRAVVFVNGHLRFPFTLVRCTSFPSGHWCDKAKLARNRSFLVGVEKRVRIRCSGHLPGWDALMSIKIAVPRSLQQECGGQHELSIVADTVRDALKILEQDHALLHRRICDETGFHSAARESLRQRCLPAPAGRCRHPPGTWRHTYHHAGCVRRLVLCQLESSSAWERRKVCSSLKRAKAAAVSELRGPFGPGVAVYSALIDQRRKSPRLLASSCCPFFGMKVMQSNDLGNQFKETKSAPAFPKGDGRALANIWSMEPGVDKKELWCGVEPASLFRSEDGGDSWEMVTSISNHEHASSWQPGKGGLCMHTIVRDGDRLHLGISTGGHYISENGGQTFTAANQGVGVGFAPDPFPEFGQCVHKIARHPDAPGRLYMQNHGGFEERPGIGVLRSDDHGSTWYSISEGLPSDFGFPIAVHPHDSDVVYVVPLEASTRTCPEARASVWRSESGGKKWKRLGRGLPKKDCYFTVLRDAMDFDECKSPALYFGTTTGQLWMGRDGGEEWTCLFDSLPPINCVKVALVQ